jgi:formylglycine-generating enzyme required for sulfatase activity
MFSSSRKKSFFGRAAIAVLALLFLAGALFVSCPSPTGDDVQPQPLPQPPAPPPYMVRIPAGTFTKGSPSIEPGRESSETQSLVTVAAFSMARYQVTQAKYEAIMGTNPSAHSASGTRNTQVTGLDTADFPVENVSWYSALVYCNKLSMEEGLTPAYQISGSTDPAVWGTVPTTSTTAWNNVTIVADSKGYRLPTAEQWEYACRAGTTTAFNWGTDYINTTRANYNSTLTAVNNEENAGTPLNRTSKVGSYAPNAWGLYDMHGNVEEWCWDTGSYGSFRVYRGGGWNDSGRYLRSAYSTDNTIGDRNQYCGFRVVRP